MSGGAAPGDRAPRGTRPPARAGLGSGASLLFLLPWLVCLALFHLFPLAHSFALSFTDRNLLRAGGTRFVGLANYESVLGDPQFWQAMRTTGLFVIGTVPVTIVLALALALFLARPSRAPGAMRAIVFFPSVVSFAVVALVFKSLYSPSGPLLDALASIGVRLPTILNDPRLALPAVMVMDIWMAAGYYAVLLLAGLLSVPGELYDAARLDGAGAWQTFRRITLPGVRPVLLFALIINTIRSFQVFVEIYVMTRGGPLSSTMTAVYYLYEEAFFRFEMGRASAASYLLFAVILAFSLVQIARFRLGSPLTEGSR
jgi:multiple sugar transport system permease protein